MAQRQLETDLGMCAFWCILMPKTWQELWWTFENTHVYSKILRLITCVDLPIYPGRHEEMQLGLGILQQFWTPFRTWCCIAAAALKFKSGERQTLHNAELVEVVFDSEGAVETLADAETEQFNFHIVWTLDGSCLPRINKSIRQKYSIYASTTMRRTSSTNASLVWSCAAALDLRWWKLDPSYKTFGKAQAPEPRY